MIYKLQVLANYFKDNNLLEEYFKIIKLSSNSIYFYSYVPTQHLKLVFKYGLASSKYIKNTPELLNEIFSNKLEKKEFIESFEENDITLLGPSVWLSKPNLKSILNLDPNHPLSQGNFTLIKINYSELKKDQPDLKVYGLELIPYKDEDYDYLQDKIEHELEESEIEELARLSFNETWSNYIAGGGYYSPNVPHAVVLNSSGIIPPKYLSIENN